MASGYKWKPLQQATPLPPSEELISAWIRALNLSREEALAAMAKEHAQTTLWRNDLYQVEVREMNVTVGDQQQAWCHLNIRRIDGYPGRDWRHFQQIKNELVGPECEAIELYPAESRLVDTSNKYHLWCCRVPSFRFPFGWNNRDVDFTGTETSAPGLRQAAPMQFRNSKEATT